MWIFLSEALTIPRKKANDPQVENHCSKRCHHFQCPCLSSWNLQIRPQVWGCKFLRGKWKWTFAVFGRLHKFSDDFYYLDIWQCARYFVAALFKELALITIREMWGFGLELPGLGFGFFDKVSVSSRNLSQVSEITVSTTSLLATHITFVALSQ